MIVRRSFLLKHLLTFGWFNALRTAVLATLAWAGYELQGWTFLAVPFLPVATIGTAVAFYVGFKNNSSYDRLWEGRKIWGAIVNVSRAWASETCSIVGRPQTDVPREEVEAVKRRLVRRQIAWVHVLRLQLRRPTPLDAGRERRPQIQVVEAAFGPSRPFDEELGAILTAHLSAEDAAHARGRGNVAAAILGQQIDELTALKRRGWLDDFEHSDLKKHPVSLLDAQGAAERIKTFPFPRQYGNFSLVFVNLFNTLLPFGLLREVSNLASGATWLVIPFSVLISWVFYSMEQVGDASENPFEGGVNDVPLTTMCRNIEIELLEALGERDLPERLQPVDGLLL